SDAPLQVTLTTNLRDLVRNRDSTQLDWYGAEMQYVDDSGVTQRIPVEVRARGHFRRQSSNCSFPPLYLRTSREVRTGTIMQGNPRLKIVTPCRPDSRDYQDYIFTEYQIYRAYAVVDSIQHRTRLAHITYADSAARMNPVTVHAFFLETAGEVADEFNLQNVEDIRVTWEYVPDDVLNRLSLFQYWIGNTDWSLASLHNIALFQLSEFLFYPVAYDFDFSGAVNARYATPDPSLRLGSVRQRRHRGPCRTAEQWQPTLEYFKERRAALDSVWSTPLPGQNTSRLNNTKRYLDQIWDILDDPRRFKREVIDQCQPRGN